MEWVAIAVTIARDPAVHRMAGVLKVRIPEVVGLLTLTLGEMTQHAPDGRVADVPDSLLETWANWHGRRGQFAAQFRAELCDDAGLVTAWEKYNGAAIRRAQAARERSRDFRNKREAEHANANRTHTRTRPKRIRERFANVEQDKTGQDQTELVASAPHGAERLLAPGDDALAPAGAAPGAVAGTTEPDTGDYLHRAGTRDVVARLGHRPPDEPPAPVPTLRAMEIARQEREAEYRDLLTLGVNLWMEEHPEETKAIGFAERANQGFAVKGALPDWQTSVLRERVFAVIAERLEYPTLEAWDGQPFGGSPQPAVSA